MYLRMIYQQKVMNTNKLIRKEFEVCINQCVNTDPVNVCPAVDIIQKKKFPTKKIALNLTKIYLQVQGVPEMSIISS